MTRQHVPHRMSLPPPWAIGFVSKVVLGTIAIVFAGLVVSSAPRSVVLSMAVALAGVLIVSGILAAITRSRLLRARPSPWPAGRHEACEFTAHDGDTTDMPTRELAWLTLGLGSMAILAIALVVPDDLGAVLAAMAFAGLAVFRVSVGWAFRVPRDTPPDDPRGTSRRSRANASAAAEPSGSSTSTTGLAAA